jgi:hypothetical protein
MLEISRAGLGALRAAAVAAAGLACVLAGSVQAADLDFSADPDPNSSCWLIESAPGYGPGGETFIVPAGDASVYSFGMVVSTIPDRSGNQFSLSLHTFNGNVPGPALATGSFQNTPAFPSFGAPSIVSVPGGVSVVPGNTYVILATYTGGEASCLPTQPVEYADGVIVQRESGPGETYVERDGDASFQVSFTAPVAPVPTMTEWAMIVFGLILASGAALTIHRRRFSV